MRPVYRHLREDGAGRARAFLLATGLWCVWPFRRWFPVVDDADLLPARPGRQG